MIAHTNIEQLRKKYGQDNYVAVTIDIDWASEACIAGILNFFRRAGIPLTIFCTHPSAVIDGCREDPQVELGIHPNFCGQSSQGETMDEILDYCLRLVPGARCVRGHRWFSSNDMYDRLVARGILFDTNESSMLDLVPPYIHRSGLLRLPVFFEDGGFLWSGAEMSFALQGRRYFDAAGLKVLDLHPIHFAINSPTSSYYRCVGDTLSREDYTAMDADAIDRMAYAGYGMRNYIMELVEFIQKRDVRVISLGSIYDELVYEEG